MGPGPQGVLDHKAGALEHEGPRTLMGPGPQGALDLRGPWTTRGPVRLWALDLKGPYTPANITGYACLDFTTYGF